MPDAITGEFLGTGRRKCATARVRIKPGNGKITVNRRAIEHYFPVEEHRMIINRPFVASENSENFDVRVNVQGGGIAFGGSSFHGFKLRLGRGDGGVHRHGLRWLVLCHGV